jgi:hypothetical protein
MAKRQPRIHKLIEHVGHAVPFEFALRDRVEHAANLLAFADLPDVVQPDVPGIFLLAFKDVRIAAHLPVLFNDQAALFFPLREQARRGKRTDS